jgi:hypothetical protein
MNGLKASAVAVSVLALSLGGPTVTAKDKDKVPGNITVAFGTGNNNAQAGNKPNHHIIPQEFKVRITKARNLAGDVLVVPATVNFIVSGFHWPWVYTDGVTLDEVKAHVPAAGTFVNYEVITSPAGVTPVVTNVFAKGIFPGNPPTFADAAPFPLSATQNRTDSFGFSTPGKYLVICNVRGHFIDGMYAWINVVDDDD